MRMSSALVGPLWGRRVVAGVGFGAAVAAVAVVGSVAAASSSGRYEALELPSWAPPAPLFGPVWTVLYALIAFAGWRLWDSAGSLRPVRRELALYAAGLVLNGVWTPLFFALGAPVAALVDIVVLDLVVAAQVVAFARRDRTAGLVLVPYLMWTVFATALNAAIVALN